MPETKRMSPIGSLTWGTANTRSQDTTSSVWPRPRNGVKTAIELSDGELAGYDLVRQFLTSDGRSSRAGHPHRDRAPAAPRHKSRTGAASPDDDHAKCHSRRSRPDRRRLQ
jgi:hypothetical protein